MAATGREEIVGRSVREHDPDRYLSVLFAPARARPALMALYAFSIDVSRIPEAVSEPMLGEIRLQWWRDALAALEQGGATGNPVADALGEAMREHGLPKTLLLGAIDARSFDLSGSLMPDRQAMKAYLVKTSGSLFAGAARILADGVSPAAERLSSDAGYVWGLTGLLRALPLHLSRGRLYLPASDFEDKGADPGALLRGQMDDASRAALAGLRREAREAWSRLRNGIGALPSAERTAFLPLALVPAYLDSLDAMAGEPLEAIADINPLMRIAKLTWAAMRGRV